MREPSQVRWPTKFSRMAWVTAVLVTALVFLGADDLEKRNNLPATYGLRFGKNPYLPSRTSGNFEGFLNPEQFPTAAYCGKCHKDTHSEWRQSAHANAFRAPFYLKNVQILIDQKGIEYTRHCESCHNPIALFSGALTKGATVDRAFDEDGVTCMVCHSIEKIKDTAGIGSYVMGVPAVMVDSEGVPVTRPVSYDDILARPDLHSRAVMRDFYRTSEFCAVCHKAAVPKSLNEYKWLRAFAVYDEWQQSAWAMESPASFYAKSEVSGCQTCHMPGVASGNDYGAKQGKVASHRWLGANTAIPYIYGYDEQLRKVTAFLRDDTLGIDVFALEKGFAAADFHFVPLLEDQKFSVRPGETIVASVVIQNKKIGHSLVPEQRDFYESWVEFIARDASGTVLYHSGYLKPDGFLEELAHSYTNRLLSKEGRLLDRDQVWETRVRAFDNTIQAGRSDLVRYRFRVPTSVSGPITLTARVNYRRFRRGYTDFIMEKSVDFPIVEMASRSVTLNVGKNSVSSTVPDPKVAAQRWNNYGIALLGQRQNARAAEAFGKVVELTPDYVDGHINIAVAKYSAGSYEAALKVLDRVLRKAPGNMRAQFYQGRVLRAQYRMEEAVRKLKPVVAVYPRFRQVRQDLGYAYFWQKRYDLAREQYEALQAVDPDDLSAHYYLSIIYRQLGLADKAAEQAAFYADRKDDPGAALFAQEYGQRHPEIVLETLPYHVHENSREALKEGRRSAVLKR